MTAATTSSPTRADRGDVLTLLGLVAHLELVAFTRLAADSAMAPTLDHKLQLAHFSAHAVDRLDRIVAHVQSIGGSPEVELSRFSCALDDFDARTTPGTWWERLLTAYVGYGVAEDFCRAAAAGADEATRELVMDVLDGAHHADLTVSVLSTAATGDAVLASRLALWGRRLVGESLGVVQTLLTTQPGLARLALDGEGPAAEVGGDADPTTRLFGRLTAEHTRRMGRLGLTA